MFVRPFVRLSDRLTMFVRPFVRLCEILQLFTKKFRKLRVKVAVEGMLRSNDGTVGLPAVLAQDAKSKLLIL